jgi:hypothetical protein
VADVHIKTLRRAAEVAGGEQELAVLLKVTPSHLRLWMTGFTDPPGDIFLRAVDVVLGRSLPAPSNPGEVESDSSVAARETKA